MSWVKPRVSPPPCSVCPICCFASMKSRYRVHELESVGPELVATWICEGYQRVPTPCGPRTTVAAPLLPTICCPVPDWISVRTGTVKSSCGVRPGRHGTPGGVRPPCWCSPAGHLTITPPGLISRAGLSALAEYWRHCQAAVVTGGGSKPAPGPESYATSSLMLMVTLARFAWSAMVPVSSVASNQYVCPTVTSRMSWHTQVVPLLMPNVEQPLICASVVFPAPPPNRVPVTAAPFAGAAVTAWSANRPPTVMFATAVSV